MLFRSVELDCLALLRCQDRGSTLRLFASLRVRVTPVSSEIDGRNGLPGFAGGTSDVAMALGAIQRPHVAMSRLASKLQLEPTALRLAAEPVEDASRCKHGT